LLAYVLHDCDDAYGLRTVALYDARFGHLAIWPVTEFINRLAGRPAGLDALRMAWASLAEQARKSDSRNIGYRPDPFHQSSSMYCSAVPSLDARTTTTPPQFLQLAADPIRWHLMTELARSDLRVRELTSAVGIPQNAVSYHLARLREVDVVSMRRSSADKRDAYYHLELSRCRQLFAAAGAALHPALVSNAGPVAPARGRASDPIRVLFLCTGNSGRSQIAEALLERIGGERFEVRSAGSHPKPVHAAALRIIRSYGLDVADRRSKSLTEFADSRLDYVITLCDKVREVCPDFPGHPEPAHWSIPDPAVVGDAKAVNAAFENIATDLATRVEFLVERVTAAA
jgi:protein-tyrosine-phosphatase/DNA-binding transcriptional ArsR family regulator